MTRCRSRWNSLFGLVHGRVAAVGVFALALPVVMGLAGCALSADVGGGFTRVVLFDGPARLNGCAVGDLDATVPGLEIAAVDADGRIFVVACRDGVWRGEEVGRVPGEMLQCAIGDADLDTPGLELVVVGMADGPEDASGAGQAHLVRRTDDGWSIEPVFDDGRLLHAVCVTSGEVWVAGFTEVVWRLAKGLDGWDVDRCADLDGAAKSAVAVDGGVAFACTDGAIRVVTPDASGWSSRVVNTRTAARARLAYADGELLCADDDGQLTCIDLATGESQVVVRERQKLRGAVLADIVPDSPGLEAATAGYGRRVWIAKRDGDGWQSERLHDEPDRVHHVAAGDLHSSPGIEFVTAGFTGQLVMYLAR